MYVLLEPNFYPEIIEDEDSKEPRQISVKFKAMAQEDINGPFLGYKLEIFDSETKNHISDKLDRDMGFSGEVKTLTVTGLFQKFTFSAPRNRVVVAE